MLSHLTRQYCCYRLNYHCLYDEESVWELVQRHGGFLSIRQDCIDFFMEPQHSLLLILAFPLLQRRSELDWV